MPKFKIIKTYQYTTETTVEAKDYEEAVEMARNDLLDEEINHDDEEIDYKVKGV